MNPARKADIVFACGAPGSGKTHELLGRLARSAPDRLIVVDPEGEYDGCGYLHDKSSDFYKATLFPTFRSRLRPHFDRVVAEQQFDFACRVVRWHADAQSGGSPAPRIGPVAFVVDELADYVGPSFRNAPASWRWIIRRGRKHGVTVLAASQRPAEIDKTLFDLASTLWTGRLNNHSSQLAVAAALDVPAEAVKALTGHEFIQRDKNSGALICPTRLDALCRPSSHRQKGRLSRSA